MRWQREGTRWNFRRRASVELVNLCIAFNEPPVVTAPDEVLRVVFSRNVKGSGQKVDVLAIRRPDFGRESRDLCAHLGQGDIAHGVSEENEPVKSAPRVWKMPGFNIRILVDILGNEALRLQEMFFASLKPSAYRIEETHALARPTYQD